MIVGSIDTWHRSRHLNSGVDAIRRNKSICNDVNFSVGRERRYASIEANDFVVMIFYYSLWIHE